MLEAKNTVRVACLIPNGLMIRVTVAGPDDGTGDGQKMMGHGGGYRLNGPSSRQMGVGATARQDVAPGVTDVPADYMSLWFKQNELNEIVRQRQVWILEENPTGA